MVQIQVPSSTIVLFQIVVFDKDHLIRYVLMTCHMLTKVVGSCYFVLLMNDSTGHIHKVSLISIFRNLSRL